VLSKGNKANRVNRAKGNKDSTRAIETDRAAGRVAPAARTVRR
jgi:hypothetical protein